MMPTLYTTVGPWTFQTFTLFVALAVVVGAGVGLRRARRAERPGALVDAYLAALAGGVLLARLFHVLLNWNYFAENLAEAWDFRLGGLDWHGAVMGGILGLWLMLRIKNALTPRRCKPQFHDLLDSLTPALPLIGLGGWYGCLAAGCGYGLEVDSLANYPAWAVAETVDVFGIVAPRYNTQVFGLALSLMVLLAVMLLFRLGWLRYRRFWLVLALLSLGMFVIGFYRGDYAANLFGLRGEQVLDMLLFGVSFQQSAVSKRLL